MLDASDFKRFTPPKRYTLLLCLIQQMRVRTRDDIAGMVLKRVSTIEKRAKQELAEIQMAQRSRAEKLAMALDDVLAFVDSDISDFEAGQQLRTFLNRNGAVAKLRRDCAAVKEWDNNNYLPLLWKYYRSHRKVLFRSRSVSGEAVGMKTGDTTPGCGNDEPVNLPNQTQRKEPHSPSLRFRLILQ